MRPDDPWQLLTAKYPEIAQVISSGVENILEISGLDEKTRQLIYIAVQTAACYPLAVRYHVPLARQAGATEREIVGAAAIAAAAAGPKGFVMCLPEIVTSDDK